MALVDIKLSGTTDGSGDLTATATEAIAGYIEALHVVGNALASTADVTISDSDTAQVLLTLTNTNTDTWYYTRAGATSNVGAAITNSFVRPVVFGQVRAVVAQGGATKAFSMIAYVQTEG